MSTGRNAETARQLAAKLDRRIKAAAALLAAEHKKDLSTGPPASKPGEFPHFRTLNLRDSVGVERTGSCEYRVGYLPGARYILFLAKKHRLTVRDTAQRIRARLVAIIRGA